LRRIGDSERERRDKNLRGISEEDLNHKEHKEHKAQKINHGLTQINTDNAKGKKPLRSLRLKPPRLIGANL
jgi:hypothetical protein